MVKNIVFDMGNVLVKYDAGKTSGRYIEDVLDRERVQTAVFASPEWVWLDMGVMSEKQALCQICGRLPERLHEAAALCLANWDRYNMWKIEEMEPLIRGLKQKGYGLYVCSNASMRLPGIYRELFPAVECFDGVLFSAEVKCVKPQREMYEHFFRRFQLKPEECFFIDDLQLNIDGARACGMDGYCFADGDIKRLTEVLENLEGEEE